MPPTTSIDHLQPLIELLCSMAKSALPGITPEEVKKMLLEHDFVKPGERKSLQPLLTVKEVATWLHLTPRTIQNLLAAGDLERIKLGRACRVSRASVEAYLSRSRQGGGNS